MLNRSPIVRIVDRLCRAGVRPSQQCHDSITFARLRFSRSISTAKSVSSVVADRKTQTRRDDFTPGVDYERVQADVYALSPNKKQLSEWGQKERQKVARTFKKIENMMESKNPKIVPLLKAVEEPMVDEYSIYLVSNRLKKKRITLIDPEVCGKPSTI